MLTGVAFSSELIRQRDETVRSAPVDPTTLEEKLK